MTNNVVPMRRKGAPITAQQPAPLQTVRLKEIVAVYTPVQIRCAVGALIAEAPAIHSAEEVHRLFSFMEYETREQFFALHLNTKHEILCLDQVSVGSLTSSIVHPREVFKSALLSSAAAILFVHNHPSGDPTPSKDDYAIHERLCQAGKLLCIPVLDSVIIGSNGRYTSLATESITNEDDEDTLFV
jgi:DNA repair protein RadC